MSASATVNEALPSAFRLADCTVRSDVQEIEAPDGTTRLEPKAMGVLLGLAERPGEVVARQELLDSVWKDAFVTEEVLTHCIWELRKAFGDSARTPKYIQTVPRKGYRLLPEVEPLEEARRVVSVPSLAVLPFRDLSPEGDAAYFCDGMVEELTHALSRLAGLRVLSRTSAFRFQGNSQDLAEVGSALEVDLLLEGSVRPAGAGFRTLTRLVEVATGFDLWAEAYHHDFEDVYRVQQEIARSIVLKIHGDLIGGIESLGVAPTGDVETYRLHLKARHAAHERKGSSLERAAELYRSALERDPEYAPALAGLAEVLLLQAVYGLAAPSDTMPEAKTLASSALELRGARAETYAALGCVQAVYEWSWSEAEESFREGMAADPYAATAPHWYGINCLAPQGRFDEARYYLRRAQALDPLSAPIQLSLAMVDYFDGRPHEAIAGLESLLALTPGYPVGHLFHGLAKLEVEEPDDALRELEASVDGSERSPESLAYLAYGSARAGRPESAEELLEELGSAERYISPHLLALIEVGRGRTEAALERLEAAAHERAADLAWLAVRPAFAPISGEPRFRELVSRLGLERS